MKAFTEAHIMERNAAERLKLWKQSEQAVIKSDQSEIGIEGWLSANNAVKDKEQALSVGPMPEWFWVLCDSSSDPEAQEYGERQGIVYSAEDIEQAMMSAPSGEMDQDEVEEYTEEVSQWEGMVEKALDDRLADCWQMDVSRTKRWTGKQKKDDSGAPVGTRFVLEAFQKHEKLCTKRCAYHGIEDIVLDKAGRVRSPKRKPKASTGKLTRAQVRANLKAAMKAKREAAKR